MKNIWFFALLILVLILAAFFFRKGVTPHGSPIRPHPVEYAYYQMIDESNGKTITYISVPVTKGDEYVTADNRRFVVVRVKENRAYARLAGKVHQKIGP